MYARVTAPARGLCRVCTHQLEVPPSQAAPKIQRKYPQKSTSHNARPTMCDPADTLTFIDTSLPHPAHIIQPRWSRTTISGKRNANNGQDDGSNCIHIHT